MSVRRDREARRTCSVKRMSIAFASGNTDLEKVGAREFFVYAYIISCMRFLQCTANEIMSLMCSLRLEFTSLAVECCHSLHEFCSPFVIRCFFCKECCHSLPILLLPIARRSLFGSAVTAFTILCCQWRESHCSVLECRHGLGKIYYLVWYCESRT